MAAVKGCGWLLLVGLLSLGSVVVSAGCGDQEDDWVEEENYQIAGFILETYEDVTTSEDCKDKCIEWNEDVVSSEEDSDSVEEEICRSVDYMEATEKCTLNSEDKGDDGVAFEEIPGVTYYELTCASDYYDDDDGFLDTLQDNPEYAAMVGMGAVILLLAVTAVIAICVMSPRYSNEGVNVKHWYGKK